MKSGPLRHFVRIEKATDSQDTTYGAAQLVWTTFAEVWASVKPLTLKSAEQLQDDKMQAGVTHLVGMWFLEGITPKMRIIHKGRELNIISIANVEERDIELEIMCGEVVL